MCGRYVLSSEPDDYAEFLRTDRIVADRLDPSHNVAPTDPVYVAAEWGDERLLGTMRWGLVPHWADDRKTVHINARAESVATKPVFRDSFSRKRCIIPADGFYEWEPKERGRTPHLVRRADRRPLTFAGIWATWKDPRTDELVRTCSIITMKARDAISHIHHRMPVVLATEVWDPWLDRTLTDVHEAEALLASVVDEDLEEYAVSSRVNSVRNNDPGLVEPAD